MGLKRVSWVRRYQGQCRALRPLGHQGCRLRNHKKDQPLCSGYRRPHIVNNDSDVHVVIFFVSSLLPLYLLVVLFGFVCCVCGYDPRSILN